MWFFIFKVSLILFSVASSILMVIFSISPKLYMKIEKFLSMEFGGGTGYVTVLEGEVDFVNVWIIRYHFIFGPVLAVLAAINVASVFKIY